MNFDVKPLRYFLAVARYLSFSQAADSLHVTQPTLSAQIRELERFLGFPLFIRSTRRVELTSKAKELLPEAQRLVEESDRLKRTIKVLRRAEDNHLLIGAAFYTIDIPERVQLLESFVEARPDIHLEVDTRWQYELMPELVKGELDLMLHIGTAIPRTEFVDSITTGARAESTYPDDLRALVIRREPIRLLVPKESSLARHERIPLAALAGQKVAVLSPQHGVPIVEPITHLLDTADAQAVVPPEAHGIGVERFGQQFRIPAFSLGWFANSHPVSDMLPRALEGLDAWTELTLLGSARANTPAAETFWQFVEERA